MVIGSREKLFKYLSSKEFIMREVVLKLEVPKGLESKVELAVEKVLNIFLREVRFEIAREILEESELSEEKVRELAKEVNLSVAKRHLE